MSRISLTANSNGLVIIITIGTYVRRVRCSTSSPAVNLGFGAHTPESVAMESASQDSIAIRPTRGRAALSFIMSFFIFIYCTEN